MNDNTNWQKNKILRSQKHQLQAATEINNLIVSKRVGREITLIDGEQLVEYMSCSYLGLDQDERVINAAINSVRQCGVNFAVARTRLRVQAGVELEYYLNQIFHAHCITFTSLHIAHLGIFPLIASGEMPSYPLDNQGIAFIIDKKSHASIQIQRGLMNQFGELFIIDFNQLDYLEFTIKNVQETKRTPLLIADGVCSMGGLTPVKKLLEFAEKYNGYLYLDDAHGVSIQGRHGFGYVLEQFNHFPSRLILAISLSKGFGTNGAAIAVATEQDESIVRTYASPYLFSNPLPLSIVGSAIASAKIHLSNEIYTLQATLSKNIRSFDELLQQSTIKTKIINFGSQSPIRGIKIGDEFKDIQASSELRKKGIVVTAAMYPTVARGESILRFSFGANHTYNQIKYLTDCLLKLTI